MKKLICFVCLLWTCCFSAKSQTEGFQIKNNICISLYCDFKVESYHDLLLGYTTQAPFEQLSVDKMYSFGANTSYTFYLPIKNNCGQTFPFFTRFVLGGEYNKYGKNQSFLFNAEVLLGYAFKMKKIGLEIFTGPKGKFAPYNHTYTIREKEDKLNSKTIKMYTGGVYWTAGIGIRGQHVGLSVSYNQGLTKHFEHIWNPGDKNDRFAKTPMFNTMTVGIQYYF